MRRGYGMVAAMAVGIAGAAMSTTAYGANLYTSNFGAGPNNGRAGWTVYSPYTQVDYALGYLNGSGATFEIASPVAASSATLKFTLADKHGVYGFGASGHEADTFNLYINNALVLSANLGLEGGDDKVLADTAGAELTGVGASRTITVPFTLLFQGFDPMTPVENRFAFTYDGLKSDGDAFFIDDVSIDYVPGRTAPPSAAPEPAAWALLILGFGGAGALLRRRRPLAT